MINLEFPAEFFQNETRCGYEISEEMKKIWAIELDLLAEFINVCKKNNLNYFVDGGTMLGAVRHKGFIPWDDDIDVIMPRKDYDKLFEISKDAFQYPYFFQTTITEDGFFRTHAQLRNSTTTGYIEIDKNKDVNKGIFLDIFPLDGIPDSRFKQWKLRKRIEFQKKILAYEYDVAYNSLPIKGKLYYKLIHLFFNIYPFKKYYDNFNKKTLAKYSSKKTNLVGDLSLKWRENVHWKREWFDGYIEMKFEHINVRIPLFYKEILNRQYGDYMKFPKNIKAANGKSHGNITFDPDTPYSEYFKSQIVSKADMDRLLI